MENPEINAEDAIKLARFFADCYVQACECRDKAIGLDAEETKTCMIMEFPVLQGTRNQIKMKEFSEGEKMDGSKILKFLLDIGP